MELINISELRANLLSYLKKAQAGQPVTVTSNGEILATIASPVALRQSAGKALNELASKSQADDLTECTNEPWKAMQ